MELDLEGIWQEYGLQDLQNGLEALFPEFHISLREIMEKVLMGDFTGIFGDIFMYGAQGIYERMAGFKNIFIWLLLLGIAAGVMTHFVEVFHKHQIADLSYYFMYLLFVTVLFRCFIQVSEIVGQVITNIVLFIRLMVPTYLLAVGVTTGVTTVSAYSQLLVLVVYGVESFLDRGITKMISAYMMLSMLNGIWIEERLSLLADFLKKIVTLSLKSMLGVVTGISIFQTLITPVIDSAKSSMLQKTISAIPGIGNISEGVMELVIGSAVIIKNSIGVVILLLLIFICAAPLLEVFIIGMILRLAAAVLGIVSDKRLVECTNRAADAGMLMFRVAGTALVLFLIVIAVLATATNRGI